MFWVGEDCGFRIDELEQSHIFTLDHMDAVAAALGMRFTVNMNSSGHYRYTAYTATVAEEWKIIGGTDYDYEAKREASLAALLAILNHKLQEDGK